MSNIGSPVPGRCAERAGDGPCDRIKSSRCGLEGRGKLHKQPIRPDKEKAQMRSTRLIAALAAASAVLMLAATGASARPLGHRHSAARSKCRIDLIAEPHRITSGESVQVFGRLICAGSATEGQTVTIYGQSVESPGYKVLATPTTAAGGYYSFVQSDVTSDSFFYASALGATSATRKVLVAPVVMLKGPSESLTLYTGFRGRVTFEGSVPATDAGATLALQRENATSSEEWHVIQRGTVGAGGVYSITHVFVAPGDANLRVVVRPHSRFSVRGISNTLSYGISQKENPSLTINTSAYSIPYGSPVALSGVLAAGAGKTVTLQARTHGGSLAPVATTTAGSGGEYKFVVTPLQNTAYKATGGGLSSTILFEGVKYVLSAGASASTVQSGQPLTFAGTVTPGTEGVIYLERENAFGGGFHVVDVGTVLPGGRYSITDNIFGAGKAVFRVKAPGNPDNQQTASTTFPVEITPAPPSSLKPATQPKVPSEGTV
jgi:hypothetical protein